MGGRDRRKPQTMTKRLAQIRHAAELYYEQNLSQQEISKILGCSHSTTSRLLSDARELGVVEFRIRRRVDHVPELAIELRRRFGLRDAVVVPGGSGLETAYRNVGMAAAEFLAGVVENGMKVGVTWGRTLAEALRVMEPQKFEGVQVVQISGSLGPSGADDDGPKSAIRLAELLNASCHLIPAPAVADSEEARDLIARQPQIRRALDHAADVDVMMQGIGSLSPGMSSLERAKYITDDERRAALAAGAVGHVFARMIDIDGREVSDYSRRVIGMPLSGMRRALWSIGISASIEKAPAILGALRGRYFNAVVVEEASAREILKLATDAPVLTGAAA